MCCDFTICIQLLTAWRSWGRTSSNGVHSWRKALLWRQSNVPSHRLYGLWCNLCRRPVPFRSTRWVISGNNVGNLWNNSNILYNTYSHADVLPHQYREIYEIAFCTQQTSYEDYHHPKYLTIQVVNPNHRYYKATFFRTLH